MYLLSISLGTAGGKNSEPLICAGMFILIVFGIVWLKTIGTSLTVLNSEILKERNRYKRLYIIRNLRYVGVWDR